MTSVEKTGKSIVEAKEAALHALGIDEDDALVEILETPSAGFLGIFGKKDARVRVTKKAAAQPEPPRRRIDMDEIARKPLDEAPVSAAARDASGDTPASTPAAPEKAREDRPHQRAHGETSAYSGGRHGGYRQGYANDSRDEGYREEREWRERKPYRELTIDPTGPVQKGREFLEKILSSMELEVRIEVEMRSNGALLNLFGENLGILIGKHGQTLDALQYLTNLAANQELTDERVRIIIDVEDYRMRREDTLRRLASRLAEKVRRTRQRVVLEPMNRHERKIIHMALTDEHNILTYSAGDEPYRKVVIEPKHARGYRRSSYDDRDRGDRYERRERSDRQDRDEQDYSSTFE